MIQFKCLIFLFVCFFYLIFLKSPHVTQNINCDVYVCRSKQGVGDHWGYNWRPFQSFLYGITPLFGLMSSESYSDAVFPWTLAIPETVVFFYVYIILALYTLLNLAIAVQVDEFQRLQTVSSSLNSVFHCTPFHFKKKETSKSMYPPSDFV
jgi:hypothetical protein